MHVGLTLLNNITGVQYTSAACTKWYLQQVLAAKTHFLPYVGGGGVSVRKPFGFLKLLPADSNNVY